MYEKGYDGYTNHVYVNRLKKKIKIRSTKIY